MNVQQFRTSECGTANESEQREDSPVIRTFAERLRNAGKTGKQIIVAAMRKLLHLIYGVVKNNAPFDPNWGLDR